MVKLWAAFNIHHAVKRNRPGGVSEAYRLVCFRNTSRSVALNCMMKVESSPQLWKRNKVHINLCKKQLHISSLLWGECEETCIVVLPKDPSEQPGTHTYKCISPIQEVKCKGQVGILCSSRPQSSMYQCRLTRVVNLEWNRMEWNCRSALLRPRYDSICLVRHRWYTFRANSVQSYSRMSYIRELANLPCCVMHLYV